MTKSAAPLKKYILLAFLISGAVALAATLFFLPHAADKIAHAYAVLTDKSRMANYVSAFGPSAPFIFMLIQILQVVFAPIPGEMTGFAGGYLFGLWMGFVYSSIALSLGSIVNFSIGRLLGKRYIRRFIPPEYLKRFDAVVKHEGALVLFILFVFPGFPKDYLCLFLGLTAMPLKIFIWMSTVGRMPGTFMLSLQGSMVFKENYMLLAAVSGVFCLFVLLSYYYRESLYRWIEKQNNRQSGG
jgi:uncharacterized membrane protein YdjX (TVP38/TMEM64 family)